jgi:hypothetical protein
MLWSVRDSVHRAHAKCLSVAAQTVPRRCLVCHMTYQICPGSRSRADRHCAPNTHIAAAGAPHRARLPRISRSRPNHAPREGAGLAASCSRSRSSSVRARHAAGLDTAPIQRFQHEQDLAPPPMTRERRSRSPAASGPSWSASPSPCRFGCICGSPRRGGGEELRPGVSAVYSTRHLTDRRRP